MKSTRCSLNKLTIMAASLPDTPPLEFIEAAAAAGYDGIGLRLHKSPAFPNWQDWLDNEPLKREVKRAHPTPHPEAIARTLDWYRTA